MTQSREPADQDSLRAGNADRERVVALLNTAFAEGRLDVRELDERVAAAYAAKTVGDLRPLTADLPAARSQQLSRPIGSPPARTGPGGRVDDRDHGARAAVVGLVGLIAVNVVIWGVASAGSGRAVYFWPVWLLIPLVFALVRYVSSRRD